MTTNDRPLLLCYDGSEDAKHAIHVAARTFGPRAALVLSVWQDAAAMPAFAWAGAAALPDLEDVFAAARDGAQRMAEDGAGVARAAGFEATPVVAEATGPVWSTIVDAADKHDAEAVVLGSRGLTRLKSVLLGSVSSGVVHHTRRPAFVVPHARP
jgi:nucleotide-binding universal stress UspA family protein